MSNLTQRIFLRHYIDKDEDFIWQHLELLEESNLDASDSATKFFGASELGYLLVNYADHAAFFVNRVGTGRDRGQKAVL